MKLRKITQEELNRIVDDHQHWLKKDCEGWEKMRADLSHVDLSYGVDLSHANLSHANLIDANLSEADLSYACLRGADLSYANLNYACLRGVNLSYACLRYVNLKYVNLSHTNLSDADLSYANLNYACLRGADLNYANLSEVKYNHLTAFFALQCPEKGSFIGYKKSGDKIVELRIEEDSKRSSATSRKCRASKVKVLSITSIDGTEEFQKAQNTGVYSFTYEVGKTYEIYNFDDDRWNECSTGIHFFITRDEAVRY